MKFKRKRQPRLGESRTMRKFLLFPKTINSETRWLETATWVEMYTPGDFGIISWTDVRWGVHWSIN